MSLTLLKGAVQPFLHIGVKIPGACSAIYLTESRLVGGAMKLNVLCGIFQRSPYQCVPVK